MVFLIKKLHPVDITRFTAIADDSRLVVDALDGAPGIYSSRYAGEQANSSDNIKKLLHAMKEMPDSTKAAYFYCVIVYLQHAKDPAPIVCTGQWKGIINKEKKGNHGFLVMTRYFMFQNMNALPPSYLLKSKTVLAIAQKPWQN